MAENENIVAENVMTESAAPEGEVAESVTVTSEARGRRKERVGKVVSDKMDKTIIVTLTRQVPHPLYKKYFKKTTKFVAHDEKNDAKTGDTVRIMETRPLSKTKRWRVVEVLERAK
jgi:small subunit ribosomal protein S17